MLPCAEVTRHAGSEAPVVTAARRARPLSLSGLLHGSAPAWVCVTGRLGLPRPDSPLQGSRPSGETSPRITAVPARPNLPAAGCQGLCSGSQRRRRTPSTASRRRRRRRWCRRCWATAGRRLAWPTAERSTGGSGPPRASSHSLSAAASPAGQRRGGHNVLTGPGPPAVEVAWPGGHQSVTVRRRQKFRTGQNYLDGTMTSPSPSPGPTVTEPEQAPELDSARVIIIVNRAKKAAYR
jgi:hypothetical protein